MKLFLKYKGLFSLPFIALFLVLLMAPYSKKYGYHFGKNGDCNTSWLYYRVYENAAPIDVAFLGSSHTLYSINDSLIERAIKSKYGRRLKTSNLSNCINGRDIQYPLLDDILSTKTPKLVIIEVKEMESKASHQDFAYIADYKTVFSSFSVRNFSFFSKTFDLALSRFSYLTDRFIFREEMNAPSNYKSDFMYQPFNFNADSISLVNHKANKKKQIESGISSFKEYQLKYSEEYVVKMVDRLKEEKIPFVFLYIPGHGVEIEKPLHYDFLTQYGEVWLPPATIFENQKHWVDGEHLNYEGSKALSNWLVDQINTEAKD